MAKKNLALVENKVQGFEQVLTEATNDVLKKQEELANLRKAVCQMEEELNQTKIAKNRLMAIAVMNQWKTDEDGNERRPFVWHLPHGVMHNGKSYNNQPYAWKEYWAYKMHEFEFTMIICERTDLKKYKFEVTVKAERRFPYSDNSYYRDYRYLEQKYFDIYECEKQEAWHNSSIVRKFTKVEDAREYMEAWKEKLEADHKIEINAEKLIMDSAREYVLTNKDIVNKWYR
jgi:hypothetical protein